MLGVGFFLSGHTHNPIQAAWTWCFLYMAGIVWIAPAFHHFVTVFVEKEARVFVRLQYLIGLAFVCFVPSRWFFSSYRLFFNSFYFANAGPLFYVFLLWWMGSICYSHKMLLDALAESSQARRNQIKYFLLATILGFSGGSYGYLANMGFDLYPWGDFTVPLYPWIMSMAIVRHRLLDITVVIRKTLVYSLLTAILAGVYMTFVILITRGLGSLVAAPGIYSSAAATAVVAILFHPLQLRIQRWVNRRFPREALDPVFLQEATGRFIHEIKRPLAKITLPAQLALSDLNDLQASASKEDAVRLAKVAERLHYIVGESMDAARHIEAIRSVSAAGSSMGPVSLDQILTRTLASFTADLERANIQMTLMIPPELPVILGNADQLEIAFSNVTRNAIEALAGSAKAEQRQLRLQISADATFVSVRIADNGPGIPPADMAHVFEPYFSSKGSKGMGLGLYLVDQIIRRHGGSIEALNDQGALFILRFPVAHAQP